MLFGFNHSKCKTQCRLGVGRIKLLRNKKQLAMKQLRREVAELLRQDKQGNARIRVEAVIREYHMLEAYELLELYLELLAVRAELLAKSKEIPPDMWEAISSLIYAGERVSTDLAEVAVVAKMLVSKFNSQYKEAGFPHEVVSDLTCRKWLVNDKLVECLAVTAPRPEKKLEFLANIAEEHDVGFDRDAAAMDMVPPHPSTIPQPTPMATLMTGTGAAPAAAAAGLPMGVLPTQQQQVQPVQPGWAPPSVPSASAAAPPPATGGWHPPGTLPVPPAQQAPQDPFDSVVVRGSGPAPAAATARPGGGQIGDAWNPPNPEDMNRPGRAFQSHVGHAAAWRQNRMGGSPTSSGEQQFQGPRSPSGSGSVTSAAAAAAQQYPPPAAAADRPEGPLPGSTAHSSGGSTPSIGGDKPMTPGSSYTDASAAAEAAKRYSQMAQLAAQKAEEFAANQKAGGAGGSGPSSGPPGSGGGSGGGTGGASDGSQGSGGSGSGSSSGGGGSGSGGGSGAGGGSKFVARSVSEIQRAYDAAPGPPAKTDALHPSPPSAPPPAVGIVPPASGTRGAGASGGGSDGVPELPSVPSAAPGAGQGPPPPVEDELDELTKRFEALKRRH